MAQPSYGKSYPFEEGSGQEAGNAEWRHYGVLIGDGIVNDLTGSAFAATPNASDRTIVVALNELRIRGIHFEGIDPSVTITLSAVSAGFTRADRIVARYDPSDKSISIIGVEGSAVNTGSPALPSLQRNSGGTWDLPLWHFVGGNVAAGQLSRFDDRSWIGWRGFAASAAALPDTAPIGSTYFTLDKGHEHHRKVVSGVAAWVDLDQPTWTPINLPSDLQASSPAPAYCKVRGVVYMRGTWAPKTFAQFVTAGGTNGVYSLGTLPTGFRPSDVVTYAADRASNSTAIEVTIIVRPDGTITARVQGNTNAIAAGGGAFVADGS